MNVQAQYNMQETQRIVSAGPGRRSSWPVFELSYALEAKTAERLRRLELPAWQKRLAALHSGLPPAMAMVDGMADDSALAGGRLAALLSQLALGLQQLGGHSVSHWGLVAGSEFCAHFWFQHEDEDTAQAALDLGLDIVQWLLADGPADPPASFQQQIATFLIQASSRAMPPETQAIARAARARGIPVMRMDRPPYDPIRGPFRLRYHSLLRLGHGQGQQTVDGCFAVSRSESVLDLVRDRVALFERLRLLSLPLPADGGDWLQSPAKAGRVAERLGFPVMVRSARRGQGFGDARPAHDREQVTARATLALESSQRFLVQRHVPGRTFKLLVAGGQLIAVFEAVVEAGKPGWHRFDGLHDAIGDCAVELAGALDVGLLVMSLVTPDPRAPMEEAQAAIVDVALDPVLGPLLADEPALLARAAEAFVDWLFPDPCSARIPIIAVTGTNGKTTTTRMLARMAEAAGYGVGEAGSMGCWVAQDMISEEEDGHIYGHYAVLDHPACQWAVLESTRGAVATRGLGFDRCDTAICLNVTADHLEDVLGLTSIDQVAVLKQAIVERADQAVVLNADDPRCLAMAEAMGGRRIGLVSMDQPATALLAPAGPAAVAAVIESRDGVEWLVLHEAGHVIPLLPADGFPLAFGGTARLNLLNALHAALAAWLTGLALPAIVAGLKNLPAGPDGVSGRLNFREGLSFRLCMDYAHNPDGMRALCDFVDRQQVDGRRILCFSSSSANSDELIRATAEAAAGHFDHYICKNFGLLYDRQPEESPRLLREGLVRGGVDPACIECVLDEFEAFDHAMGLGRPGDLVVLIGGKRRQALWERVMSFKEGS